MTIPYKVWGGPLDDMCKAQVEQACTLPVAVACAILPDFHVGYGICIGGVIGLENAVVPFFVGVDIACRMRLSLFELDDEPARFFRKKHNKLARILEEETFFGVGVENPRKDSHAVLNADWEISQVVKDNKEKATKQLGTSGSGNHFVEWGIVTLEQHSSALNLQAGKYLALMSHSGSRGPGAAICNYYTGLARDAHPEFGFCAWLDMDSQAGQEYWAAMSLMGEFAAANHQVIHEAIALELGEDAVSVVENHHNYCFKETHGGKELYVHRKGATPAGEGVLGVIPGSMGTPAFVVKGKGNADSLNSASHGAGRLLSRKKAKEKFSYQAHVGNLKAKGITVLSAGADEVCGAYKDIHAVMAAQQDLVSVVARFDPKIVKMCGDKSRAED